jgi:hypothetical protein
VKKSNSFNDFDGCTVQQALCTGAAYVLYVPPLHLDLDLLRVTVYSKRRFHSYIRLGSENFIHSGQGVRFRFCYSPHFVHFAVSDWYCFFLKKRVPVLMS